MALEATSWDWLRDGIMRTVPSYALLERVENGVGVGTADVNYVIRGVEGWIELKAPVLPKRRSSPVLTGACQLNPEQVNWHMRRAALGGRTFIFVSAQPYRWLVDGVRAKEINNWDTDQFCDWAHFWYDENWKPPQWNALIRILTWTTLR